MTNFTGIATNNTGTLTQSNLTVAAKGCYQLTGSWLFDTGVARVNIVCHAFTNGVEAVNCGFHIYLGTANQYGSASISGLLCMEDSDYVDIRLDLDKNATITFDHAEATLIFVGESD